MSLKNGGSVFGGGILYGVWARGGSGLALWGSGAKVNSAKRKKKKSSANKVKREKKVQLDGILVD